MMQQVCFVTRHIHSIITLSSIISFGGLTGCLTTNLQNLAVEGPIFQPPVHMTQDSMRAIQLHPWITMITPDSRIGVVEGHTKVNSNGIYYVDTIKTTTPYQYQEPLGANKIDYRGNNFSWQLPSAQYGLDLDITISNGTGLSVGGSYASVKNNSYWQAYGMLSAAYRIGPESRIRSDAGVEWQNQKYDADFVHTTVARFFGPNDVEFLSIHNAETQVNYFYSFTINSISKTSLINLFLQAAVVRQSLFYISDATGSNAVLNDNHETHYLYSLSPGLSIRLAENVSAILGIRFIWDASMESKTTTTFQPLLQFDIGL
jgi:hypothetical protein